MFKSILVPLDGTTFGEHALPLAISLARAASARLHLVQVHVPLATVYTEHLSSLEGSVDPALKQRGREYLRRLRDRIKVATGLSVEGTLLEGPVVDALLDQASMTAAELVIMARHGRGTIARAVLGSVADEMVRRSTLPLMLVRPHGEPVDLAQPVRFRRVLVALDGSAFAEQVLEPTAKVAKLLADELLLYRAVQPMILGGYDMVDTAMVALDQSVLEQLRGLHETEIADARTYLERKGAALEKEGFRVSTMVTTSDKAATAILDEVRTDEDLVALATHGRTGFARVFLGSVADKVLRGSTATVLIKRVS